MPKFVVSAQAERDLEDIGDFISLDNPVRAVSFIQEITLYFWTVAERPMSFPDRADLAPQLRSAIFRRYLILFEVGDDNVKIARVVHGARNLKALF